jgi:hypothetical protein
MPVLKVTPLEVQLCPIYFVAMLRLAKDQKTETYGGLIERAKAMSPGISELRKEIPVRLGRRLGVVRMFTRARNLPDLTALVGGEDGNPGEAYVAAFDVNEQRSAVFRYDWRHWLAAIDGPEDVRRKVWAEIGAGFAELKGQVIPQG